MEARGGEDIQNQRGAIHHFDVKHFFQIFLHDPGEDFVKDDQIGLNGLTAQGKLLGLALADAEGGIGGGALLQHPQHGFGSGGLSQFLQLVQRFLAFNAYQDRPLMNFLQFFFFGQIGRVGLLDMIQPVLLGQTAGGQQLRQHIPGGGMLDPETRTGCWWAAPPRSRPRRTWRQNAWTEGRSGQRR